MYRTQGFLLILVMSAVLVTSPGYSARNFGGGYSAERISNLRRNCERYDWAVQQKNQAVSHAQPWLAKSDEDLWNLVPGQDLPRCIDVTFDTLTTGPRRLGCLQCGEGIFAHGNYPYEPDFVSKPWKLSCPSCGAVFPTNDFGKYYKSAIDEHGLFNPSKGDRSLLFNTQHPDPKDPLHKFGVDDGFGYIDAQGRSHKFIGYYTWKLWRRIYDAVSALSDAYLYTGEKVYARKAAILLDRIADVYPDMDWAPYARRGWFHSDSSTKQGKIEGCIWECGTVTTLADAYDKILSGTDANPELDAFLKRQMVRYKLTHAKGTRELLVENIDNGLLRCAAQAVFDERISGNEGMHQLALIGCALALNTEPDTSRWLDWLFLPQGGAIPGLIVGQFDRDGVGPEAAPGYALSWGQNLVAVADKLQDYPQYTRHSIYRDFPQFRATFTAAWRMAALGRATPNIGDSGAAGFIGCPGLSPSFIANGYSHLRDPEIAVAAYRANGNRSEGLGLDIFAADPEALGREIAEIGSKAGPRPIGGQNMTGYGLSLLECGNGTSGTALACYSGETAWHCHLDQLNFDLLGFGTWLAPDHGYPEFAADWPSRSEWTRNTISHNTVVVDQTPQGEHSNGRTRYFKQLPGFGAFELDSHQAYPQTREYARTMLLIDVPGENAYAVDIFRVEGGQDHLLSFHGPPGVALASGLHLTSQAKGTYAGEDVALEARPGAFPVGYSYLYNVETDKSPPAQFQLDWKAEAGYRGLTQNDNVHLRMHSFTPSKDVSLADGDPPQNKPGNPRRLRYALVHRQGHDLSSTFVSVLEPYRDKPFIRSVTRMTTNGLSEIQVALRVELVDSTVDTILFNPTESPLQLPEGISCSGRVGFLREERDTVTSAVLIEGKELDYRNVHLKSEPALEGKIIKMNRQLQGGGWVWVDTNLPAGEALLGQQIIVETTATRNACYNIERVEREGNLTKVFCGPIAFVRDFAGPKTTLRQVVVPKSYNEGYLYDFEEGARFRIPVHTTMKLGGR